MKCFTLAQLCNDFEDCEKGTDERNCPNKNNEIIAKGCDKKLSFTCANKKCIPIYQHCDGIYHCDDKSDEISCSKILVFILLIQSTLYNLSQIFIFFTVLNSWHFFFSMLENKFNIFERYVKDTND